MLKFRGCCIIDGPLSISIFYEKKFYTVINSMIQFKFKKKLVFLVVVVFWSNGGVWWGLALKRIFGFW